MAEEEGTDDSQKTEDPTPKRLQDARKRGQVIHSREINNWIILFAGSIVTLAILPTTMEQMKKTLVGFIEHPQNMPADEGGLALILSGLVTDVGMALFLPVLVLFIAAIAGPLLQIGLLFTTEPLTPKLEKISPLSGLQRLFSFRSIMEFVKGLLKITIVGAVGVMLLLPFFGSVEHFVALDMGQALFELKSLTFRLLAGVLAVLSVIAVIDYLYQRHDFMKKIRMSKQELKEEYKQTEGDPHIKARLREIRQTKARQRMMQAVPEADVVITNPTHYAVALKYETKEMDAPIMVAKGADQIALKIKEVAKEHKVPIVENAPLARALYDSMDIDEMIPRDHYKAVAEIISYVFKLKSKRTG